MDSFLAARLLALKAVLIPTREYRLRQIRRWYSREFHTPLYQVDDIPDEYVLQAFYECQFEQMDNDNNDDLEEERRLLTESIEERRARLKEEDAREVEDEIFRLQVMEEEEKKLGKTEMTAKKCNERLIVEQLHKRQDRIDISKLEETAPADISLSFEDDLEFAELDTIGKIED